MKKKAYLIGAGGAGMSAVAKYLYKQGYAVSGSDSVRTGIIDDLVDTYEFIYTGDHHVDNIHADIDLVVYTPAVGPGNVEYDQAITLGLDIYSYPEYLGIISEKKKTVVVSGTNGKTTTTTMLGESLVHLGLDPTIIVGGVMKAFDTNYVDGNSELFVVEGCEYKESFLSLVPDILVLTNITPDHLDYFGTYENYKRVFIKLIENMQAGSHLVCNELDPGLQEVVQSAQTRGIIILDYLSVSEPELAIPGAHNVMNAQAALGVVEVLDADVQKAKEYLQDSFQGSKRRFEAIGTTSQGYVVYDDYAHNPEALETLINGLQTKSSEQKVVIFFQPHLYSRTRDLFNEFAAALNLADQVFLLPIYAAREVDKQGISSMMLAETMKIMSPDSTVQVVDDFENAVEIFNSYTFPEEAVVLTVGAGDIYKLAPMLVQ